MQPVLKFMPVMATKKGNGFLSVTPQASSGATTDHHWSCRSSLPLAVPYSLRAGRRLAEKTHMHAINVYN
jgi:hypothetical protein